MLVFEAAKQPFSSLAFGDGKEIWTIFTLFAKPIIVMNLAISYLRNKA
jgi:hypothetical protein